MPDGNFDLIGTWHPKSPRPNDFDPRDRAFFVIRLCQLRKQGEVSPKHVAALIAQQPSFSSMFPNAHLWHGLEEIGQWRVAPCSTSAEEAVKRMGLGTHDGHWLHGLWTVQPYVPSGRVITKRKPLHAED